MNDETWLRIPGFNVEISDDGRLRLAWATSTRPAHAPIESYRDRVGRPAANVIRCTTKKTQTTLLARLVLLAHAGPPPFPTSRIQYLDGDHYNLDPANLSWTERVAPPPSLKTSKPTTARGGKQRCCMTCRQTFWSEHCGHRMCERCRTTADDYMSDFEASVYTTPSALAPMAVPMRMKR